MKTFRSRQRKLSKVLNESRMPALLVTNKVNLRWLTGFHCSYGYLLCVKDKYILLTDARYTADARDGAAVDEVIEAKSNEAPARIAALLSGRRLGRVAFEPEAVSYAEFQTLEKPLGKIKLIPSNPLIEELRNFKDETEIARIQRSSQIMDRAFKKLLDYIRPGVTEAGIRAQLELNMIGQGIDGISFDTIVASGPRGAFAHGKPSARKIRAGEFIVLDFGVCTDGYHSDMTRTVFVGTPTAEDRRRYRAVREAQQAALDAAVSGIAASVPDLIARQKLAGFGLDRYFTHGLGHGVGMDVHEQPRLYPGGKEILKAGMVYTIEPGIYIEGWGGIRIEDTVVLTKTGPVPLTRSPKKLIAL
jgi:Xaa-Pro aminopeptidase